MNNKEKLKQVFIDTFSIAADSDEKTWVYSELPNWDSVGHMQMISNVEEEFDIMIDTDDIIDWGSFEKGIEILSKYDVEI